VEIKAFGSNNTTGRKSLAESTNIKSLELESYLFDLLTNTK
jgi:hypothetical protein